MYIQFLALSAKYVFIFYLPQYNSATYWCPDRLLLLQVTRLHPLAQSYIMYYNLYPSNVLHFILYYMVNLKNVNPFAQFNSHRCYTSFCSLYTYFIGCFDDWLVGSTLQPCFYAQLSSLFYFAKELYILCSFVLQLVILLARSP